MELQRFKKVIINIINIVKKNIYKMKKYKERLIYFMDYVKLSISIEILMLRILFLEPGSGWKPSTHWQMYLMISAKVLLE